MPPRKQTRRTAILPLSYPPPSSSSSSGDSNLVRPGETVRAVARTQIPFHPTHFLVDVASIGFVMSELRIGNASQFASCGDAPASIFAGDVAAYLELAGAAAARGEVVPIPLSIVGQMELARLAMPELALALPEMYPGTDVMVEVRNAGNGYAAFRAVLLGTVPPMY